MAAGGRIRPNQEERKQTTATFGEQPAPIKRDESPIMPISKPSPKADNKPKLFKGGGTNPFAKRGAGGFGGAAGPS